MRIARLSSDVRMRNKILQSLKGCTPQGDFDLELAEVGHGTFVEGPAHIHRMKAAQVSGHGPEWKPWIVA